MLTVLVNGFGLANVKGSAANKPTIHKMNAIKSITILWAESNLVAENTVFDSLESANRLLAAIANENKGQKGYCKVKYTATFEDGGEYTGRADVHGSDDKQETVSGKLCFLEFMQDHVSFISGLRKPDFYTDAQYAQYLNPSAETLEWVERLGLGEPDNIVQFAR